MRIHDKFAIFNNVTLSLTFIIRVTSDSENVGTLKGMASTKKKTFD